MIKKYPQNCGCFFVLDKCIYYVYTIKQGGILWKLNYKSGEILMGYEYQVC